MVQSELNEVLKNYSPSITYIDSNRVQDIAATLEMVYNNTQNKRFPDGKICYTTIYKGVDIWYHEECELGCFVGDIKLNLIPIDELKFIINI